MAASVRFSLQSGLVFQSGVVLPATAGARRQGAIAWAFRRTWRVAIGPIAERMRAAREGRALAAMGPFARLELDALLTARGGEGLYASDGGEREDIERLWGRAREKPHAAVAIRLHRSRDE